ncbi:hypothetical protein [Actinoplanes aureus]|uniref:Peptidase inhibitor family I36 n=1 Tax=Actinoplanes aureus TaxID=2792083 RepID=A0A931CLJ6_9ACTN|nr:hypothetical protein [Actinoplanes aureus]MBG0568488.1 hypothetical protein [Actinoplanes aureus]
MRNLTTEAILLMVVAGLVWAPSPAQAEPGVVVLQPYTVPGGTPPCPYKYFCVYENAFNDSRGAGRGLAFYRCYVQYNLGHYSYPDFILVGERPGPEWNDRISSVRNNQIPAAADGMLLEWWDRWRIAFLINSGNSAPHLREYGLNDVVDGVMAC